MRFLFLSKIKGSKYIKVIIFTLFIISLLGVYYSVNKSYAIKIENEIIGEVKNKKDVENIILEMKSKTKGEVGQEVSIIQSISYEKKYSANNELLSTNAIKSILEENLEFQIKAYILNVNGVDIAKFKEEASINQILNRLKNEYVDNSQDYKDVDFVEEVKILKENVKVEQIDEIEQVYERIMSNPDKIEKYVVKKGDTISYIAIKNNINFIDIIKANPDINIDKLQVDQVINLCVPNHLINIKTVKVEEFEESIAYDIEYKETEKLYKGQTKIEINGLEGKKSVEAKIIKINNIVTEKIILSEEIIEKPKTQVVLKGTKEKPKTLATNTFTVPSRGIITSRFGSRWGSTHRGIDIGVPKGTPNKAADGGKVIFSGWKGSYGKLVIIDHENGYKTYYAHNDVLKVKNGQRVYKGQVVGLAGTTGNTTGPHLHFEVIKNGKPVNPLSFINL